MLFGLDGVEIGLIIVFLTLFAGIMTGFPVGFAIGGAAVISFAIIAALDSAGLLIHQAIDSGSAEYAALLAEGVARDAISVFRYPELPRVEEALFPGGWEQAMERNISFIVNRMNERVIAGQSIETLLAVLMFVMMGITLERSRIAEDLLTTMARVFGPLPGGLAVSIVIVGAFLAASTGIVGATVVTMGLLALPTMLRNGYSPKLATGVIAASGTLGQIIPPSIVIVLLGTLVGDLYATGQETRAQLAGCGDALTFLGKPAVLSVGTLFQAALLPGLFLAGLYAAYAFGFALFRPEAAPPVQIDGATGESITRQEALTWYLFAPAGLIAAVVIAASVGIVGSQSITVSDYAERADGPALRTNVSEQCQASMIELHGQEAWDEAVAQRAEMTAAGDSGAVVELTEEEREAALLNALETAPAIGSGVAVIFTLLGLVLIIARGVSPTSEPWPLIVGGVGVALAFLFDVLFISPLTGSGATFMILAVPMGLALFGCRFAMARLSQNELLRVVFPPLILIVAVLGSILGGITNPTPAAALGAAGAIMLAAYRKLKEENGTGKIIIWASFALVIMILVGVNFDLRVTREVVPLQDWIAYVIAQFAYHFAFFGLLYACWVLLRMSILGPVVRETAKVTSMVFTILIGSQLLNLVLISFGGEHYIQQFLRAFDNEWTVFLLVMLILFILGFVLDFLEIIYIVVPIVGPVIYGGTLEPTWVTIMIAINLQTSFLTPPFGFALFYLRGVAPPGVTTGDIYRGVLPFVAIQVLGLVILALAPGIVTIVPNLLGG
ncbi:TRAP transporter large permease subunit [Ponticoccus sp. SC2-23]|uniref:TRAP transporter large permease n=1 Tax=Alexandriicola marinus TaxID=2081710 RepID=UPI000FDC4495|nr:TRAP transporter large permease subunit [Alexandriicola marinus]MBM1219153.1 TRAP transporter large permease subunit [Ponticoccus sp. SC6-9]MBM1223775.1 TRAP transporter large permease subunit [Ponticoccus sp. SC6-15]MBM1228967.1 TRAP transporter large permease subunit [Ponticoccus sp. SC6-38]MBM1232741.1 TRAP transporter large permease subunit [Ponticoccus sp. SC6-45]MBM1237309.1 TRAP transporter large permease subunit [Ponticoccus sp. SC6-49]MBM1241752.1 TRAP transporter large permease s